MATYEHIIPGMQADAAKTFPALLQNEKDYDNDGDELLPGSTR
jgi:hypothetical protein